MQTVSETYAALWRSGRHRKEHKAVIAGVEYGENEIVGTPVVTRSLFAQKGPGVGACVAGQLELSVLPQGEIPRMAEIKLYTRLAADTYSASAMSFMKPIAQELSFRTMTPDGQVWYFDLPYREDSVNGSMMHAVGLEWSVSAGITGSVSGGYKDHNTGESVVWGEDLVFSKTAPNHSTADFSTVKPWNVSGTEYSEWIPKGVFYIDTRKLDTESGVLTLHGYDAMLKSEIEFLKAQDEYSCYALSSGSKFASGEYRITAPDGNMYFFNIGSWNSVSGSVTQHQLRFTWDPSDGMSGFEYIDSERSDGEEFHYNKEISFYSTSAGTSRYIPGLTGWIQASSDNWPRKDVFLVSKIASIMGVETDPRTVLDAETDVPYPIDWTCREILSYIAIAHCGNWTITDEGKLRLVPLWSIPEATHYLVDQYGDPITMGGVKILVD